MTIQPDFIKVEDNGLGMDWEGLRQYFNIGSPEKVRHSQSPIYKRDRIGQFGIGKFASLAACERFEVHTQKNDFAARVIFDKNSWEQSRQTSGWELPVEIVAPDKQRGDGTTVILTKLTRAFDVEQVRQKILESVPIQAKNFAVYVNDRRVVLAKVPGHRIPFLEGTEFGPVHGEVVIAPVSQANAGEMGLQVRVKGVMVKREYFGIQGWGKEGARIRGEVNADFLPVTSDRSGFRTDTPEYAAFTSAVSRVMEEVRKQLGRLTDKKETQKVKRALKEAIDRIQQALGKHPELVKAGLLPFGEESEAAGEPAIRQAAKDDSAPEDETAEEPSTPEDSADNNHRAADVQEDYETPPAKPKVRRLTPNAVIRKIKVDDYLVSCCLDYFGEEGPECFTQGQIIYINRDHPLYKRESKHKANHTMYLARLLSQEIALMKSPPDPRAAFQRQSELLREAFAE